jgi:sirohydrochlorin cobaltochelatase
MQQVVVLAMHGAPPNDFPRAEIAELVGLHSRLEQVEGPRREALARRHDELDAMIRAWPRSPRNDPFWAASMEMADHLSQATGLEVIVGFNEFCAPSLDEALDRAASRRVQAITVITPMMTRGGVHAEVDIPDAIRRARERHPGQTIRYAWPFEISDVARFLAAQIDRRS